MSDNFQLFISLNHSIKGLYSFSNLLIISTIIDLLIDPFFGEEHTYEGTLLHLTFDMARAFSAPIFTFKSLSQSSLFLGRKTIEASSTIDYTEANLHAGMLVKIEQI